MRMQYNKSFYYKLPIFVRKTSLNKTDNCSIPVYFMNSKGEVYLDCFQEPDKNLRKRIIGAIK